MYILRAENFGVRIGNRWILKDIDFRLKRSQIYVLFGPNGSGKTTIISAIAGLPGYEVEGKIFFDDKDITDLEIDERANLGISVAFQYPPEITGVKLEAILKRCLDKDPEDDFSESEMQMIESFKLAEFLNRDINVGFSGGERKRAEMLQMFFLRSELLLLDEPDSGVDVDTLKLMGEQLQKYIDDNEATALIVTHQGGILEYMDPKYACVLFDSSLQCFADPNRIAKELRQCGYQCCIQCNRKVTRPWNDH